MKKAVVLLSGGMDSATVLAYASQQGYDCYALSFRYGQRHSAELAAAVRLAETHGCRHEIIELDLSRFGGSALTDLSIDVPDSNSASQNATPEMSGQQPGQVKNSELPANIPVSIPVTYVPARNTVFLSVALAWAEALQAHAIFIGVNAVDYSGYPDCRPEFIRAFETMANLATKEGVEGSHPFKIHTPLIDLTKSGIIRLGTSLGVDYSQTVTCYRADEQGRACGRCDACVLRKKGFEEAGCDDTTRYF